MACNVETARAYYEAAEGRDGAALLEILHPAVAVRRRVRFSSNCCASRSR
jgi:hypothetical protein